MGWEGNNVFQVVIVEGPLAGLFVYAGAPGPGNEPVFSVTAPGVTHDPYGNTVRPVVSAGNQPTSFTSIDANGNIQLFSGGLIDIVINPGLQAILIYSPHQALGNLVVSISPNGGTDSQGNLFEPGICSYDTSGSGALAQMNGAGFNLLTGTPGGAGPYALLGFFNTGGGNLDLSAAPASGAQIFITPDNNQALTLGGFPTFINEPNWHSGGTGDTLALSAALAAGKLLTIVNTASTSSTPGLVELTVNAANNAWLRGFIAGDTSARLRLSPTSAGQPGFSLGNGTAAADTSLFRAAANLWAGDYIAFASSATTAETWNAVTFANSWANAASGANLQYRRVAAPDTCIQIVGRVTAPAGIVNGQAMIVALPTGYRPANQIGVIAWDNTSQAAVHMQLGTGGVLTYQGGGAVAGDILDIPATLLPLAA